jgi:hypothetical protein
VAETDFVDESGVVRLRGTLLPAPGGGIPSGAGSPVGVVTPSGVGALYVSTAQDLYGGPTLWQAIGVTAADWQEISLTATGATFTGVVALSAVGVQGIDTDFRVDATNTFTAGAGNAVTLTALPMTIQAGVGKGPGVSIVAPSFESGGLTLSSAILIVSNGLGTEKLVLLQGTPVTLNSGDSITVNFTGATVVEQIGVDLAVAANGLTVDSTAGGQYAAAVCLSFGSGQLAS